MCIKKKVRGLLVFLAAVVLSVASIGGKTFAAQVSDTFVVSATVQGSCTVIANDLTFGAYDPSGGNLDVTTTIDVTCSNGTGYEVGLNGGTTTGNVAARAMTAAGVNLSYSLFRDASRTLNWEDLLSGNTVTGTGDGTSQPNTVYGRVPGSQFIATGTYNDTVTATVEFTP